MKILLFGKSGQLGKYLNRDLSSDGHQVLGPTHEEIDLTNLPQVENYFAKQSQIQLVINTTASQVVEDCETQPGQAFALNTVAVSDLAKLSARLKIPFISFSSDYVFDGETTEPYKESQPPSPIQIFGASKAAGECLALAHNPLTYIIRTTGLYGGKGTQTKSNFVLKRLAETSSSIQVAGNQVCSPTYVGHLSTAVTQVISNLSQIQPGILHLVNEGSCSWAEFTQEIYRIWQKPITVRPVNRDWSSANVKRPLYTILANTRAKAVGILLPNWKNGLQAYFNELK